MIRPNFDTYGKLLIKLQFLETIIKLYISLFNETIKNKKEYRIKNLSSRNILDDNSRHTRHTLGQLMKVLEKEVKHFENEEFREILSKRNTFIHNLHKEYVSVNAIKKDDLSSFIQRLWSLTEKYTDVFSGLVSISAKLIGKENIRTDSIKKSEIDAYEYLIKNSRKN